MCAFPNSTPISDTTILSAMSSKCDLRHHVYSQTPYAVTCGVFAVLVGYLPMGFHEWPSWAGLPIGACAVSS